MRDLDHQAMRVMYEARTCIGGRLHRHLLIPSDVCQAARSGAERMGTCKDARKSGALARGLTNSYAAVSLTADWGWMTRDVVSAAEKGFLCVGNSSG